MGKTMDIVGVVARLPRRRLHQSQQLLALNLPVDVAASGTPSRYAVLPLATQTPIVARQQASNCTGHEPRRRLIGSAGQHNRYPCPEHDSRYLGTCQVFELLRQHVARIEIGDEEDVRSACNGRNDTFGVCGFLGDRIVKGQRTVEYATRDLPSVRHFAQDRCIEGRFDLRRHCLDCR